jgi:hypothetical protein
MRQMDKLVGPCADPCCAPLSLVSPSNLEGDRITPIRDAFRLEWLTIRWMSIEAVVALISGVAAGSLVLIAFGLDSVVELISAGVLVWRLSIELRHGHAFSEDAERLASRIGGVLLFVLAAYVVVTAGWHLWTQHGEVFSVPGLILTASAIPIMRYLSRRKIDLADKQPRIARRRNGINHVWVVVAGCGCEPYCTSTLWFLVDLQYWLACDCVAAN